MSLYFSEVVLEVIVLTDDISMNSSNQAGPHRQFNQALVVEYQLTLGDARLAILERYQMSVPAIRFEPVLAQRQEAVEEAGLVALGELRHSQQCR